MGSRGGRTPLDPPMPTYAVQVYNLYSALVFIICSSSYLSSEVDRPMKNAMNGPGITVLDGRRPCIVQETSMLHWCTVDI